MKLKYEHVLNEFSFSTLQFTEVELQIEVDNLTSGLHLHLASEVSLKNSPQLFTSSKLNFLVNTHLEVTIKKKQQRR